MKEIINIGIAEDHPVVRQGLVAALKPHKNLNIQFEVGNGKELLDKLKISRPDIILLDLEMPIMTGPVVIEKISKKYPKINVIIVSAFFDKDYIIECYKLGVKAFLPKAEKTEKIIDAIISVYEKGIYSDIEITRILANEFKNSNDKKKSTLSNTELQVLKLICSGISRRKAADILGVKIETVHFHMTNIMRKTGCDNSSLLVSYAIQNKLLNL